MTETALLEDLIRKRLSINLTDIVLTQLGEDAPKTRSGTGALSREADGILRLQMTLTHGLTLQELDTFRDRVHKAGQLLGDSEFYRMDATDFTGRSWSCERIRIAEHIDFQVTPHAVTIVGVVYRLESKPEARQDARLDAITIAVPGQLKLRYPVFEEDGRDGGRNSRMDIQLDDGSALRLLQREGYFLIQITNAGGALRREAATHAAEAVAIAAGLDTQWVYRRAEFGATAQTEVVSMALEDEGRTMIAPLSSDAPEGFTEFVRGYVKLCEAGHTTYYGYWQKVFEAYQAGFSVAALPIAVSVEGLVNDFFPELRVETSEVVKAVSDMAKHLESSGVAAELVIRGQGALNSIKGKNVLAALKRLASDNWFDEALIWNWHYVRNKSAHGGNLTREQEREGLQEVINKVFGCLQLFYQLLLIRMSYRGVFQDLAQHGFPPRELAPLRPAIDSGQTPA